MGQRLAVRAAAAPPRRPPDAAARLAALPLRSAARLRLRPCRAQQQGGEQHEQPEEHGVEAEVLDGPSCSGRDAGQQRRQQQQAQLRLASAALAGDAGPSSLLLSLAAVGAMAGGGLLGEACSRSRRRRRRGRSSTQLPQLTRPTTHLCPPRVRL